MRKQQKLEKLFWEAPIYKCMEQNEACKYIYRKYIDKELPGNNGLGCTFQMSIEACGFELFIKVHYYDRDERYKFGVITDKDYIIPVDDVHLLRYIKRHGGISNKFCFESATKTDAEVTATLYDNTFTERCRIEKIKFDGYDDYKHWRNAYREFLRKTTENYGYFFLNFCEKTHIL